MDSRQRRIEWISFAYLVFFVLAVLSPSLYTRGYIGLSETVLEEITIFLFGLAGILTFTWYERFIERREGEAKQMEDSIQRAKLELVDSYSYIGSVNRKIELLKGLANDTSLSLVDRKRLPRELLQAIVQSAVSATAADGALLRIMEHASLRTAVEVQAETDHPRVFRIPNRELRALDDTRATHAFLATEEGRDVLAIPSDASSTDSKAYLLLFLATNQITEVDVSLLKVLVNQAEMVYKLTQNR